MHKIANWNGTREAWENWDGEIDLFSTHSDVFLETWPSSGMTRAGLAYELPMPALPTIGSESSSLPTPRASRGASGTETMYKHGAVSSDANRTQGEVLLRTPMAAEADGGPRNPGRSNSTMRLSDQVRENLLMPTPLASDGEKGGPNQRGAKGDLRLSSAVHLMPTPRTSDTNGPGLHGTGGPDLRTVVSLLPTPTASVANDGEGTETWLARRERVKAQGINGNGMPLTIAVQLLPTPTVQDASNTGGPSQFNRNTKPLNTEVLLIGAHTPPPLNAGKP